MRKLLIISVLAFTILIGWYIEGRHFFKVVDDRYVTVWKTLNNKCYIIAGRYYGLMAPSNEVYVRTTNDASGVAILWEHSPDSLIIDVGGDYKIMNNSNSKTIFIDYSFNKKVNDSLYTELDTVINLHRYKKGINRISFPIDMKGAL
jgi:hypothetical protein